jgi:hypothetical protein
MKNISLLLIAIVCAGCANAPQKTTSPAASSPATSQPGADALAAERFCQDQQTQCLDQTIPILLHLPNGTTFQETMQPPDLVIYHDTVFVFAGQTVYVEADLDVDKLVNLHAVPTVIHPEKTLVLRLEQTKLDNTPTGYMIVFHIKNPFNKTLKYHAAVYYSPAAYNKGPDGLVKTDVCPVVSKGENTESWPNPIFQIGVMDMRLVSMDDKGVMVCE